MTSSTSTVTALLHSDGASPCEKSFAHRSSSLTWSHCELLPKNSEASILMLKTALFQTDRVHLWKLHPCPPSMTYQVNLSESERTVVATTTAGTGSTTTGMDNENGPSAGTVTGI